MQKYGFLLIFLSFQKYLLPLVIIILYYLPKIHSTYYFQIFQLNNKYLLWVSSNFIYRIDQNSEYLPNSVEFNSNQKLNLSNSNELESVIFSEYLDEFNYSVIGVKHFIYLLDNEGVLLCQFCFPLFSGFQISLIYASKLSWK